MCLNDLVADGQADARTLEFLASMKPPEKLKNRRVKLRLDPDSIVSDGNRDFRLRFRTAFDVRRVRTGPDVPFDFNPGIRALVVFYAIG